MIKHMPGENLKLSSSNIIGVVFGAAIIAIAIFVAVNFRHTGHSSKVDHKYADVTFAQGMIPHHEQAIEMAKLVAARSDNAEIKALAIDIVKAQDPEIKELRAFLESVNEPDTADHSMHDMESMNNQMGMATDDEMNMMKNLSGSDFDQQFLDHMIRHHEGAIDMANDELKSGTNSEMRTLAREIIAAQEKEIKLMNDLQS